MTTWIKHCHKVYVGTNIASWFILIMMVFLVMAILSKAHAADRLVRVFLSIPDPVVVTGDTVYNPRIHTLLFLNEPCPLPIVGAETMHRAWRAAGAYQVGCWYPTLGDEYTYINGAGQSFHSDGVYWQAYPLAVLHADQSVTITQPNFDSSKFFFQVTQWIQMRKIQELGREDP